MKGGIITEIKELFQKKPKKTKKDPDDMGWSAPEEPVMETVALKSTQASLNAKDVDFKSLEAEWECFKRKMDIFIRSRK